MLIKVAFCDSFYFFIILTTPPGDFYGLFFAVQREIDLLLTPHKSSSESSVPSPPY